MSKFGQTKTEQYQKFYEDEKANSSGDSKNWWKPSESTHTCRIAPPWSPDAALPFRKRVNHNDYVDTTGRKVQPLCFDYIFKNQEVATYLAKIKRITKKDFDSWTKHGCPMCKLAEAVRNIGRTDEPSKKLWPRSSYMWNFVIRNQRTPDHPGGVLLKWNSSKKFFDAVSLQFQVYPDLFDELKGFDFMITASGTGMSRRYSSPTFIPQPSALNFDGEPHDLNASLAAGVKAFVEMLECLTVTPAVADYLKITGIDVKSFLS